jgi:hypothetical protein
VAGAWFYREDGTSTAAAPT